MDALFRDLRFGLRALARHPGLTLIAVLSLGLGIGANTTVFSWMETFVLKPLPAVAGVGRLISVHTRAPDGDAWSASWPDFRDWRAQTRSADLAVFDMSWFGMREGDGGTERAWGLFVSSNYFDVMGVRPALGRAFLPDDETSAAQVVVLNYAYWQRRFAGDSGVINRTLALNGQTFAIVGIAAPRFGGTIVGLNFDLFVPATTMRALRARGEQTLVERRWQTFDVVGRLRPGVSRQQAALEIDRVAKAAGIAGGVADHRGAIVRAFTDEGAPSWLSPVLRALLGVTGVVLLIACANVANLLLARATARQREIAIRLAVGAGRGRLVRQLLTESAALAAMAGVVGVLVAFWGSDVMLAFIPPGPYPIDVQFGIDARVLVFAVAATGLTALLFGLVPALRASKPQLVPTLKDEIGTGGPGRSRLQHALLVGQVGLSLVSLVCAGLFVRSLQHARAIDVGFTGPERVLLAETDLRLAGLTGDSAQVAMTARLLVRARAVPGVEAAAVAMRVPLGYSGSSSSGTRIEGYTPQPEENMSVRYNVVGGDYFRAMGIDVVRGRATTDDDMTGTEPVAVVNERFVERYWPGQDPIGRRLNWGGETWHTVVGVVRTGRYEDLTEQPTPMIYKPFGYRNGLPGWTLHVRTAGDPNALATPLRREFQEAAADLPFLDVRTLARHIEPAYFTQRMGAWMLTAFGMLALALSAVGIYGTMSYSVSRRTREIGVRVALGAGRRDVVGLVVGRAMGLAGLGLLVGGVAALGVGQLLATLLVGVSPRDPLTFAAIGLVLGGVALVASWIPARRAAKVDPMVALRYE